MKELILIRHAKSSWEFNVDDRDRQLTKKGMGRIKKMILAEPEMYRHAINAIKMMLHIYL